MSEIEALLAEQKEVQEQGQKLLFNVVPDCFTINGIKCPIEQFID